MVLFAVNGRTYSKATAWPQTDLQVEVYRAAAKRVQLSRLREEDVETL
jgi:hypothetical protein